MAIKLRHNPTQTTVTNHTAGVATMFVGPASIEQKAKICSRCGKVVALVYRVYKKRFDSKLGKEVVDQGQFEPAHLDDMGKVLTWDCPTPGLLAEYEEKARRALASDPSRASMRTGKSGIVHMDQGERVLCGAGGQLNVTEDRTAVTCNNCIRRASENNNKFSNNDNNDHTNSQSKETTTMTTVIENTKPLSVKEKIAAAKAKAGTAKATAPAANLAGDAPLPKATVTKKAVKVAKEPKAPKQLNICGCGCESACSSRFLPGHDAKLHGWLKRVGDGRMAVADLPEQVREGMFAGIVQKTTKTKVKTEEGETVTETLVPVAPKTSEAAYLETLKGLGGDAK